MTVLDAGQIARATPRVLSTPGERARKRRTSSVLVMVAVLAFTALMLSPLIWSTMAATKETSIAFASPPQFTYQPTLAAFVNLWQATNFYRYLENTVIIAVATAALTLVVAAPAAYALSRRGGQWSAVILAGALLFRAVPGFALALPFYNMAKSLGIYDTMIAVIIAFVAVDQPFSIWLLRNFFAAVPVDLDESALIDGCSRFGAFRRVILPVVAPGLVTAGILSFLLAFQEYLIAVVLTDVNAKTVPVFLASQIGQTLPLLQQASAGVVLLAVPIVLLATIAQRFLVAGLTAGAVKG
ncbi:MAG: carbohydrate ABC transporter permease [Chloroflexota bacterium]